MTTQTTEPSDGAQTFNWVTTSPNPRTSDTGWDAGQRGWRLHAFLMADGDPFVDTRRKPSICGLAPRHGWGLDLFINDRCIRCQQALAKRESRGERFFDLAILYEARRREQDRRETFEQEALEDAEDAEKARATAGR